MTLFLIFFFLYVVMRIVFKQKQSRVEPVLLVATRYGISPESVRSFSIMGMAGIALLIVILSIMGYRLTSDHIAYLLSLGIIVMTVQYYPLVLIGGKGIGSIDTSVSWKDIKSIRITDDERDKRIGIEILFNTEGSDRSVKIYIAQNQRDAFSAIVKEYSSITVPSPPAGTQES
jgi:hypothetical protein